MMACPGCFKETRDDAFCGRCRKRLFDGKKVPRGPAILPPGLQRSQACGYAWPDVNIRDSDQDLPCLEGRPAGDGGLGWPVHPQAHPAWNAPAAAACSRSTST